VGAGNTSNSYNSFPNHNKQPALPSSTQHPPASFLLALQGKCTTGPVNQHSSNDLSVDPSSVTVLHGNKHTINFTPSLAPCWQVLIHGIVKPIWKKLPLSKLISFCIHQANVHPPGRAQVHKWGCTSASSPDPSSSVSYAFGKLSLLHYLTSLPQSLNY
jgi:hypothetical protein